MSDTTYKSKVGYKPPVELEYHDGMPEIKSAVILSQVEEYVVAQCSAAVGVKIEREELIKALRYDRGQYEKGYADGKRDATEALQAQLPKHGEWVKNEDRYGWHCSCCKVDNRYAYSWNSEIGEYELQDKFCPNCGAKMGV